MKKYGFHAILEYGLGDYDDRVYEYEVSDEEMGLIEQAVADKRYFDEVEELQDLYKALFDIVYKAEYEMYMEKCMYNEDGQLMVEGEDFIPFDQHTLYLTF